MSEFALETVLHWTGVGLYILAAVALTLSALSGRPLARRAGCAGGSAPARSPRLRV